jgi:hypothetical protein
VTEIFQEVAKRVPKKAPSDAKKDVVALGGAAGSEPVTSGGKSCCG